MDREIREFLISVKESSDSPDHVALLTDFSGVTNMDNPTIADVLVEQYIQAAETMASRFVRLDAHYFAALADKGGARRLEQSTQELSRIVEGQGLGSITTEQFLLIRDGRSFADRIGAIIGRDPRANFPSKAGSNSDIAKLLQIENTLRTADISSLTKLQTIYDFAKPKTPVPLFRELSVSLDLLDEMFDISLRTNSWLLSRVLLILDRRMLFHLIRERKEHDLPFGINAKVDTILSDEFAKLISRLAAQQHDTLIIEMSSYDRLNRREDFDRALSRLADLGLHASFDGITWPELEQLADEYPALNIFKVRWTGDDADKSDKELDELADMVERIGDSRIVLEHADSEHAVEFGLDIGLRLFQGTGATDWVKNEREKARDRDIKKAMRAAHADSPKKKGGKVLTRKMK